MQESREVKKSPIVIVGSFIAIQFAAAGVYMLSASLFYVAQIWRSLPLLHSIPFPLAQGAFIFLGEVTLLLYMFLAWYRQTIRVTGNQLVFDRGLLVRSHTIVPLSRIATATFRQGILGRLTHYGDITMHDSTGSLLIRLDGMSDPQSFVDDIMERKGKLGIDAQAEPEQLVGMAEHERLERKSTLRWDLKTASINKGLEKAAMKTVAAFLNSQGGHLLLGIGDDGKAVGLEHDYATLARRDADGFQNHFTNILSSMLGPSLSPFIQLQHFTYEERECMLVSVSAADRPAYLRDNDHEEFFIRTGNGTTSLRMSEANAYIATRFTKPAA